MAGVVFAEHEGGRGVDRESDERHDQHQSPVHLGWVAEAADRLDDDRRAQHQDHRSVGLRGEDGAAMPAEAALRRGCPSGESQRVERRCEGYHVGQVVARVGQQPDRVGHDTHHHLCDDDDQVEPQRGT